MSNKLDREIGYYKVLVKEFGSPFWTIGLYNEYGWHFAEGDGSEMGTCFDIIEIDETLIMKDRVYDKSRNT